MPSFCRQREEMTPPRRCWCHMANWGCARARDGRVLCIEAARVRPYSVRIAKQLALQMDAFRDFVFAEREGRAARPETYAKHAQDGGLVFVEYGVPAGSARQEALLRAEAV